MDDNSDRSSSSDTDSQKIKNFEEIEDHKIDESEIGYKSFSESGYYWHGKDYANAYKEDVKDLHDFSRGLFPYFILLLIKLIFIFNINI